MLSADSCIFRIHALVGTESNSKDNDSFRVILHLQPYADKNSDTRVISHPPYFHGQHPPTINIDASVCDNFLTLSPSSATCRQTRQPVIPGFELKLKMKRIIVIGCPGAGKSTFARKLSAKTGLPLHYLDMLWHLPDRTTLSREEFASRLEKITAGEKWIIDGNYLHTISLRLKYCDTVFFFDLPLDVCLAGAESRIGKEREDMPWTDNKMDEEFRQWIVDFPAQQLPVINKLLSEQPPTLNIIIFHSRAEADAFIESI